MGVKVVDIFKTQGGLRTWPTDPQSLQSRDRSLISMWCLHDPVACRDWSKQVVHVNTG